MDLSLQNAHALHSSGVYSTKIMVYNVDLKISTSEFLLHTGDFRGSPSRVRFMTIRSVSGPTDTNEVCQSSHSLPSGQGLRVLTYYWLICAVTSVQAHRTPGVTAACPRLLDI